MNDKKWVMKKLIDEIRSDNTVGNISAIRKGNNVNAGLVNQFKLHKVIPNKWFDWERSSDAEIMIIGQDWGPYIALQKMISDFDITKVNDPDYYHEFLFRSFSSRTEKFILTSIEKTYFEKFGKEFPKENWNNIIFTMSVLFTRQGKHFRGNELFDLKKSMELSYPYVKRQIDIVKPKLIIPLGNSGFEVVNKYFNLGYKDPKISNIVKDLDGKYFIDLGHTKILPNYHPAAHVDPKIQRNIWSKMWEVEISIHLTELINGNKIAVSK